MPTINIATHLKDMARLRPEQMAVMFPAARDRAGRTAYTSLSFRQLDDESDRIAAGLTMMGIGRGVRTALMVPPSLEFFSLTFALFKAGSVPVFIDPGMGLKNIGKCLAEAEPTAFIGITKAHIARWLFGWGKKSLTKYVHVGGRQSKNMQFNTTSMTLRDLMVIGRDNCESSRDESHTPPTGLAPVDLGLCTTPIDVASSSGKVVQKPASHQDKPGGGCVSDVGMSRIAKTSASDIAAILFTSGSTGVPKGAVYSHGNFVAQVELLKQVFGIEPGEIDLCTFPLFALFASALGMTAIVPRMDFTRPARVNPREVIEPIQRFGATNMFGSPALLNAVGRYASRRIDGRVAEPMPTLKRVLSAGAPVSAEIISRFQATLAPGRQIFTPYGATESLPVAVIGSREVLDETRAKTAQGAGTCVGRPVPGVHVSIIRITDEPILEWSDSLLMPRGEIGEIVVQGPQVTREYFNRPDLTALAKIPMPPVGRALLPVVGDIREDMRRGQAPQTSELAEDTVVVQQAVIPPIRKSAVPDSLIVCEQTKLKEDGQECPSYVGAEQQRNDIAHRMGDLGYFDEQGRLWFCGRKSHRVITPERTHFTEPVEGIFNAHPQVFRTALVGVTRGGVMQPVLCVELEAEARRASKAKLMEELLALGAKFETSRPIQTILFHKAFPVDIRHNSKIFREKLAVWAAKNLR